MTIGIDASRANLKRKTGTEWYSFYLIKYFAQIDKKNKYILYLNKPATEELKAVIKDNPNFKIKVLNWPFVSFWTLGRLTWEMIWHSPSVLFVPAHAMPLVYPRKTVNTIHDIAFTREEDLYRSTRVKTDGPKSRRLIELLVKLMTGGKYASNSLDYLHWSTEFALNRAKKIITVSNFTKQEIMNVYPKVKKGKIKVVLNGYNDELYKVTQDCNKVKSVLEKYDLEGPYFLYVGRIEKKKNTPALIEALSILRDNHPDIKEKMLLIGDASFGYDEVKYVIEQFDLESDVIMPGWIDEEDMPCILNGASGFVFPSKHEGFGIPVLQAMSCGVPIAASSIPAIKEVAHDAVLYFDYNDKYAISEAMANLVKNKELREELIERGLKRCKNFSWEKCARDTLQELTNM